MALAVKPAGGRLVFHTSGARAHGFGNLAGDGRSAALVVGSSTKLDEVHVADLTAVKASTQAVTDLNRQVLREMELARPRWREDPAAVRKLADTLVTKPSVEPLEGSSPHASDLEMYDVWGSSATNLYAVGAKGSILHFDGIVWHEVRADVASAKALRAVAGCDTDEVFAGGDDGLLLRYDGGTWSQMVSPTTERIWALWARSATNVFAATSGGSILHFDGSSWRVEHRRVGVSLYGLWGLSADHGS